MHVKKAMQNKLQIEITAGGWLWSLTTSASLFVCVKDINYLSAWAISQHAFALSLDDLPQRKPVPTGVLTVSRV